MRKMGRVGTQSHFATAYGEYGENGRGAYGESRSPHNPHKRL